jgi:hypothetical protein
MEVVDVHLFYSLSWSLMCCVNIDANKTLATNKMEKFKPCGMACKFSVCAYKLENITC